MQPFISDITIAPNNNFGGICYFNLCPIEWLLTDIIIDWETGTVTAPVALIDGKQLLTGKAISGTKEFEETQADSRSGTSFLQKVSMIINKDTIERNRLTDTLRFHQWLVIYYDNNKLAKIIGDASAGMFFKSDFKTGGLVADKNYFAIELNHESEHRVPVYNV